MEAGVLMLGVDCWPWQIFAICWDCVSFTMFHQMSSFTSHQTVPIARQERSRRRRSGSRRRSLSARRSPRRSLSRRRRREAFSFVCRRSWGEKRMKQEYHAFHGIELHRNLLMCVSSLFFQFLYFCLSNLRAFLQNHVKGFNNTLEPTWEQFCTLQVSRERRRDSRDRDHRVDAASFWYRFDIWRIDSELDLPEGGLDLCDAPWLSRQERGIEMVTWLFNRKARNSLVSWGGVRYFSSRLCCIVLFWSFLWDHPPTFNVDAWNTSTLK